ncbi:MAG: sortase [Actinomycetota bacterium]|nr:sortase [Actinomycetota bacterium]MEA2972297.1 sortase [Actinomycetota bacterium]
MRGTGKTLIACGVLILLFVAYQLWGTGLHEARAQDALKDEFATVATTIPAATDVPSPPTTVAPLVGDAIAHIVIPKANVDKIVVEGVGVEDLKKGPGHYPGTPMPGEPGNAAIAGHRTTYGAPFYDLSDLAAGDEIMVTTRVGEFRYQVDNLQVVSPEAVEVLNPTEDNRLTLTTCNPRYSASERLIVSAKLVTAPVTPPPPPEGTVEPPTQLAADGLAGLSGDSAARGPAVGWGILCAAIWLATWWLSRLWDRWWMAYLVGTPIFLGALFVFFENFARLLPSNI